MTQNEFKQMAVAVVNYGWPKGYVTPGGTDMYGYIMPKLNDPKECAKIFNRCKLVAYRSCISVHDALHRLIGYGKI